jgi:micrococcal nuclease
MGMSPMPITRNGKARVQHGKSGVLVCLAILLVVACSGPSSGSSASSDSGGATPGVAVPRLPTPTTAEEVQVMRVVDGDTLEVQMTGRRERVRYIGVDTPESVAPNQPVECFGREASARNKELVEGKRVRLEKDVSDTDRFGRLLRYVWLGDEQVNARLIAEGYANVATFPPDVRNQDVYRRLQQEARTAGRGLWGACRR